MSTSAPGQGAQRAGADPVAAVSEVEARGEIADVFADIRTTLDVPFVNLVWRHLATIPDGLSWTWNLVRPLYGSERLNEAVAEIHGKIALPDVGAVPPYVLDTSGISGNDRATIALMLADYAHANGRALVALMAARAALAGPQAADLGTADRSLRKSSPRHRQDLPLPALPGLDEIPSDLLDLVHELNGFGQTGESRIVASLYRHLAHWPGFLVTTWGALAPSHRSGAIVDDVKRTVAKGRLSGGQLASLLDIPARPGEPERIEASLREFTDHAIGRMVVMGEAMRRILGSG